MSEQKTIQIEALETIKTDGYILNIGDRLTVPYEIGAKCCAHGWAKDTSGAVATGERTVVKAVVAPANGTLGAVADGTGVQ
jgi:hypothetical protein